MDTIKGYCTSLVSESFQISVPHTFNQDKLLLIQQEIKELISSFRSSGTPQWMSFKSVSSTEGRWWSETPDKSESAKQVCSNTTLQDGKNSEFQ